MQHRNDSMHGGHRPRSSGLLALLTVVLVPAMAVIVIGGFLLWRAPGATSPGTVAAVAAVGDAGGPTLREPLRRPGDRAIGRSGDRAIGQSIFPLSVSELEASIATYCELGGAVCT